MLIVVRLMLVSGLVMLSGCGSSPSGGADASATDTSVNAGTDKAGVDNTPALPAATPSPVAAFSRCAACHSLEPGKTLVGPSLAGVAGRKVGSDPRFTYSAGLVKAGKAGDTWTPERLDAYVANPNAVYPGNKMGIGVSDAKVRREIIDYLLSTKK